MRTTGLLVLAVAFLAVVRPWTVRPLVSAPAAFDAARYAEQAWPRIVAEASRSAVDMAAVRQFLANPPSAGAPGRKSVFVRVAGTVTAIDRRSRVGVARVRVGDGAQAEVAIQIGPVIRGTALRDAASFIGFNDFANQFEFAAVSNALHDRVLREVVGQLDVDALTGRSITVLGAVALQPGMPDAALDVVPIQLQAGGGVR